MAGLTKSIEATGQNVMPADFQQAAFDQRVDRIRGRAGMARNSVMLAEKWLTDDVPARIAESERGVRLAESFGPALEALADLESRITRGPYTAEWAETTIDLLHAAARTTGAVLTWAGLVGAITQQQFPSAKKFTPGDSFPASFQVGLAGDDFMQDIIWLSRFRDWIELSGGKSTAQRMRRMRARQKAGFQMVTVAVHGTEIWELKRLGLLRGKGEPTKAEISDAMQSFISAGFAATSYEVQREAKSEDPRPTLLAEGLNESLRMWFLISWGIRLRRLVESIL